MYKKSISVRYLIDDLIRQTAIYGDHTKYEIHIDFDLYSLFIEEIEQTSNVYGGKEIDKSHPCLYKNYEVVPGNMMELGQIMLLNKVALENNKKRYQEVCND